MSAHTKRGVSLTAKERAKKYGPKHHVPAPFGAPFLHDGVLAKRHRSTTLHPFAGRHRKARVQKFQGAQRTKAEVSATRRQMSRVSRKRNRA